MKKQKISMFLFVLIFFNILTLFIKTNKVFAEEQIVIPDGALEYNGHFYLVLKDNELLEDRSFESAEQFCRLRGGNLATIESAEEEKEIWGYINAQNINDTIYIGQRFNGDTWIRYDDVPQEYFNWAREEDHYPLSAAYAAFVPGNQSLTSITAVEDNKYLCEWENGTSFDDFVVEQSRLEIEKKGTISYENKYYKAYNVGLSREDAQKFCELSNGKLAEIKRAEEKNEISNYIQLMQDKKNLYWIGIERDPEKDTWSYSHSKGEELLYANWTNEEPHNSLGDCNYAVLNVASDKYDFSGWIAECNIGERFTDENFCSNIGFICEWECSCVSEKGIYIDHNYTYNNYKSVLKSGVSFNCCGQCGLNNTEVKLSKIWITPFIIIMTVTVTAAFFSVWLKRRKQKKKMIILIIVAFSLIFLSVLCILIYKDRTIFTNIDLKSIRFIK